MPTSQSSQLGGARTAAWTALSSVAVGIGASILVSLACWLPDASASGTASVAMRAGVYAFLYAHHGGGSLDGMQVGFVPLGMLIAVGWLSWRAGRILADSATPRIAIASYSACYTAACVVAINFAGIGSTHVAVMPTLFACLVVSSVLCAASVYRDEWSAPFRETSFGADAVRAGVAVIAVYLLAGSLLGAGAVIDHADRVMGLSRDVGGGLAGFPIAVIGVFTVPNAVIDSVAYLVGPGFAVGHGTVVSPLSHSTGVLPAFPLLGALPKGHGASLPVLVLMASTAVLAAAFACRIVLRNRPIHVAAGVVLAAAALAGGFAAGLCALAAGPAGDGRLRVIGASSWRVGLSLSAEMAALGLLFLAFVPLWRWLARISAPAADAADELAERSGDEATTESR